MNYGIYNNNPSARAIIREWENMKQKANKRKYNVGYLRHVEYVTGEVASDERAGYDTGNYPQLTNDYEVI